MTASHKLRYLPPYPFSPTVPFSTGLVWLPKGPWLVLIRCNIVVAFVQPWSVNSTATHCKSLVVLHHAVLFFYYQPRAFSRELHGRAVVCYDHRLRCVSRQFSTSQTCSITASRCSKLAPRPNIPTTVSRIFNPSVFVGREPPPALVFHWARLGPDWTGLPLVSAILPLLTRSQRTRPSIHPICPFSSHFKPFHFSSVQFSSIISIHLLFPLLFFPPTEPNRAPKDNSFLSHPPAWVIPLIFPFPKLLDFIITLFPNPST